MSVNQSDFQDTKKEGALPSLLDVPSSEWLPQGSPDFRRKQIIEWVFRHRVQSFEEMKNLPQTLREEMIRKYSLAPLQLSKKEKNEGGTQKFLWKLQEGDFVESVFIPASKNSKGKASKRKTLCVSTQVGCAYGCKFCASGIDGWKRNLLPSEIVSQVIEIERVTKQRVDNIVFMGMGEPFANFENLMKAITMMNEKWGLEIGSRHITISTSGIVPRILELAEDKRQLGLAISLHAVSNAVRNRIMPVNKKYPLETLLDACRQYVQKKGRMITFEYILIQGVNDTPEEAFFLSKHARRLFAKVNLIPYNPVEGFDWKAPSREKVKAFEAVLLNEKVKVTLREEKGSEINAACGQLRLKEIKN